MPVIAYYWLGLCAYLNCIGWLLSAVHQLNATGYAVALLAGAACTFPWLKKDWRPIVWSRLRRRFRQPLPILFLTVCGLAFLGGVIYAPNNFDGITYRLPRILDWLSTDGWHWIHSEDDRVNYSGVAWEWTAAPLFALLHSDRAMFLINFVGYLLLPGLVFSLLRHARVARRVAWTWMWILPLAYGFVTQAGSIANDLFGTLFFLMAIGFALHARRTGRVVDLWMSLFAIALLTSTKLSNLPLLLPWFVAVWPVWRLAWTHWKGTLVISCAVVLVSALPIIVLNCQHADGWAGDPHNEQHLQVKSPVIALLGNSFLLAEGCLQPPLAPGFRALDERISRFWPEAVNRSFPRLRTKRTNEIPAEEGSGLGLAVSLPILVAAGWAWSRRGRFLPFLFRLPPMVLACCLAATFYMSKVGSLSAARLMLPYYVLCLIPFLQLSVQSDLLRKKWWRASLLGLNCTTLIVLVLSASRPLWPAQTVSRWLLAQHPQSAALQRLAVTYATYGNRNDCLAPLRACLPEDVRVVGIISGPDDTPYSLWHPIGQRVVTHPYFYDPQFLKSPGIEWLVVKHSAWQAKCTQPLSAWVAEHQGKIVTTVSITEIISIGPEDWSLVHFPTGANQ